MSATLNKAIELLLTARNDGIDLVLVDGQLQVKVPRNKTVDPQLLQDIREHKRSLIDFLIREELKEQEAPAIRRRADRDPAARIPLSFAQERLWFIERFGGSVAYHLPWVYRITGALDEEALRDAFRAVLDRHEVLRTVITGFDGVGAQEVKTFADWDFTRMEQPMDAASLALRIQEFIDVPFDLSREPMLRALLATAANGERLLVVVVHHIAFDGWSIGVLVEELAMGYNARRRGGVAVLPPLPVQYADYALWQREVLSGPAFAARLAYWKQMLADTEPLDLVTDRPRPAQGGALGGLAEKCLGASARQQLRKFAQEEGATAFMVLLAAFNALLYRYTGQRDICVGTPIAGRDMPEVEYLVGFFVNTLALRTAVDGGDSFSRLLEQVRGRTLEAFEYKDVPFEKVVEALGVERDPARNPVFQVMFSMQNETGTASANFEGLTLMQEKDWAIPAKVDLHLNVAVTADDLELSLVYRADLFDAATADRLLLFYGRLLEAALAAPSVPIGDLAVLSTNEYDELLEMGRKNVCPYPLHKNIVSLIDDRVDAAPLALALADDEAHINYAELQQRSNRLAAHLIGKRIGRGNRVAVSLPRSIDLAVSLLAIMKTGAAYLPIDPDHPADRIRYMLNDAQAAAFIVPNLANTVNTDDCPLVIGLAEIRSQLDAQPDANVEIPLSPEDIAYVIYTSGSTGQPKGVAVTHAGLNNLIHWHIDAFEVEAASCATAMAGIGFDAFGWELWPYLAAGASVRLVSDEQRLSLHQLLPLFTSEGITHSFVATAIAADFVQASIGRPLHLRWLLTGGDRLMNLPSGDVPYRIVNNYGPTENTVVATSYVLPKDGRLPYPIGRPIANVQAYVLDARGRLALPGTAGELCLGGAQIAAGYLSRPELTAEKFIADPFSHTHHRLYRTGDRVRWLPDGDLEYRRRMDEQVKLRGYRIELGEITHLLQQAPGVQSACVLLHQGSATPELVAFVVATTWNEEAIVQFLRDRLPAYMIPALLERVPELPLTPNGKTDRARLLRELRRTGDHAAYEAPRTALESELAACWEKLLGRERIGIRDSFFVLGGHSLLAMRLSAAVRSLTGVDLPVRRIFEQPTIAGLAACVQVAKNAALPPITVADKLERMPLSYEQERLWFIDRLHGSTQYHIPWVLRLRGALDAGRLEAALQAVLERHEVLRTIIGENEGRGYQQLTSSHNWRLRRSSMEEVTALYGSLQPALEEYIRQPFDLSTDVPIRAWLIRCGEEDHLLAGVVHHIAFDGWSTGLLVQDLAAFYAAGNAGGTRVPTPLPIQYSDYAVWQRTYLSGHLLDRKLAYWRSQLEGVEPLGLITDFPRQAEPSVRGDFVSNTLDAAQLQQLRRLSQEEGVTLFMTLVAAFNVLLHRYTGQSDICVGTPVAGRQQQELEGLIGFFLNTLALRSDVQPGVPFRELLRQVRQTTLDAYEHQDVPFEKIVETLGVPRDRSRSAIFQVWIVLQNLPAAGDLDLGDITISNEQPSALTAQFDLNLDITESADGLRLSLTYGSDLYRRETATYLLSHYVEILASIITDRSVPISALPMVGDAEQALIRQFNGAAPPPPEHTLVAGFEAQALRTPLAAALRYEGAEVSYEELHRNSDQLARRLAALGVRRGTRVGLCLPKSIELITGLLAILKAGGTYVPIDPEYPAERIAYMIADSGCALVLTTTEHHHLFEAGMLLIDLDHQDWAAAPAKEPEAPQPSDPAYIIYTSGSTGRPKGVLVAHRAVSALIASQQRTFGITPQERILQFSNIGFDASVEQVFLALLSGATLVLLPKKIQLDLPTFEALLDEESITHLHATPGFLELINPRAFAALRRVIAGGEACRSTLARRWSGLVDFYNEYGPTETTVTATELLADDTYLYGETLPIGRPLSSVEAYLLEADGRPAGIGVPANLYLGGPQLAEEYIDQPGLTAQKFIYREGGRLYATGDRARWLADGNIEFLGRADDQVKIRGYRIEPAEIAAVLEEAPGVRQAVVLVQEDGREKRLAAFVVADEYDREAVLAFAHTRLPDYMMPAALVETDAIPLTASGKVDRKKLLDSFDLAPEAIGYEAPRNATETVMTGIWEELLEVEQLGIHDNFFELGGHSLLAVRVAAAVRSRLDTEIAIVTIFEHPTVARLCSQLPAAADAAVLPPIRSRGAVDRLPLSFAQERLWFIDKLQGSVQYHMPWLFRLQGRLDVAYLEASFRAIADRHEILRTVIREEEGEGCQELLPKGGWSLRQTTFDAIGELGLTLEEYLRRQIARPYELSADHPLNVTLVRLSPQEHLLLVVLHHIAFDGWSISVMVKELAALYNGLEEGRPVALAPLPVQYADYALWQRTYLSGAVLESQLAYWKGKLQGTQPLELPLDHARPAVQGIRGNTLAFTVDRDGLDRLRALSQQQGATLFMTVSAIFKLLLYRYTGQPDISIGTPVANRTQSSTDALIGFFVNTLVLRDDLGGDPVFTEFLQRVRTTALEAYAHQDTPFEKVVEAVAAERNMSYTPLFQVLFALQNTPEVPDLELTGLRLLPEPLRNTTAKFDLYADLLETPEGLQVQIEYSADLFEAATIVRLFHHYHQLLRAVAEAPQRRLSEYDLLTVAETDTLKNFNDTATAFPADASIVGLFEAQAQANPRAWAVAYGSASLSYGALNEQSNRLAHHLMSLGVKSGDLVMVCLERSIEMIISVLAILKAGAAYVPVDPRYPKERIAWMVQDAEAEVVITSNDCRTLLGDTPMKMVCVDADRALIDACSSENLGICHEPEHLVYVIYTSGSTGRPKGVELPHRALINLLLWQRGQSEPFGMLRILQFASLNFDVSFQEIFSALCFGNSLHLIDEERRKDMHEVVADIDTQQLTTLFIPYVVLKNLAEYVAAADHAPLSLREIITAGEQLKLTADIKSLIERTGLRLVNQYGPSEAHVVSAYEVQPADFTERLLPPIGRPIANTQLHILGPNGEQCPIGIAGELHIGGVQVARGYLHQQELTAERFIADPFSPIAGARLYRTGDKARWLPDGNIEFLGRLDDQVKIHGYRIELGEVEAVLQQAPGVRQAVVLARADGQGVQRLVAYVAGLEERGGEAALSFIREKLPAYMVPSLLVSVDEIPLTANGKADKRRLPEVGSLLPERAYIAPRTETEEKITAIWCGLLGVSRVGIDDNFFEIGGHSLLVTRLASAIRKEFGLDLPVRSFFELATPAGLAAYVEVNRLPAAFDAGQYEAIEL